AKDKSPRVRKAAIELLFQFREQPRVAVPVLLEALKDGNPTVRVTAATRAAHFTGDKRLVLALIDALKDEGVSENPRNPRSVARAAVESLSWPGPHARLAATALMEVWKTGDTRLRAAALDALGNL